jgi:hypothetical protein
MGSSSEADALEVGEVLEEEGFEESLPFGVEAGLALVEPEVVEGDELGDPEREELVEGAEPVVEGVEPVELGEDGGELLAVVEFVLPEFELPEFELPEFEPPDDLESSLSAAPSLRRCSVGRSLLLSSSSMTGGAYFFVLVWAFMPSGNQVPSAIQL